MTELPDPSGEMAGLPGGSGEPAAKDPAVLGPFATELPDHSGPLTPSGHLRRRQLVSRLAEAGQTTRGAARRGRAGHPRLLRRLTWRERAEHRLPDEGSAPLANVPGGGIAPEIVGTALIIAVATVIAMPMGILAALYLTEFAGRWSARTIRLAFDLLYGVPTIIIGLFVFGLLVVGHHQSGFAGSFALAIIMLPLIARATQEVLLLVPPSLREAADALGVSHWRTVRGVVLPSARGGILTATVLAVARGAGETAPLIFVCSIFGNTVSLNLFGQALPNIPVYIFTASEAAERSGFARAWGAAFVLLAFILLVNIGARALGRRGSALQR